jgi:hypothetical protein
MKRLIFLMIISASLVSFKSYANEVEVSSAVLKAFQYSFKNATDVNWTTVNNYYKADFNFNDQRVAAFYDQDGKLMAITRNISSKQLCISLQADLKRDYEKFWISDLFELSNEEGTAYFVTLQNSEITLVLKSGIGGWSVYKKIIK